MVVNLSAALWNHRGCNSHVIGHFHQCSTSRRHFIYSTVRYRASFSYSHHASILWLISRLICSKAIQDNRTSTLRLLEKK